jgi:hypothetical protein
MRRQATVLQQCPPTMTSTRSFTVTPGNIVAKHATERHGRAHKLFLLTLQRINLGYSITSLCVFPQPLEANGTYRITARARVAVYWTAFMFTTRGIKWLTILTEGFVVMDRPATLPTNNDHSLRSPSKAITFEHVMLHNVSSR